MLHYVLATIRDTHVILGYRILFINKGHLEARDVEKNRFLQLCACSKDVVFQNAKYNAEKNELEMLGTNIDKLPIVNSQGILRTQGGLTLLYSITDKAGSNSNVIGYGIADSYGMVAPVKLDKLLRLTNFYRLTNFEVYTKKDGTLGVRLKAGNLPSIVMEKAADVESYNSKTDSADKIERAKTSAEVNKLKIGIEKMMQIQKHENNLSSELKSSGSDNILPGLHVYNFSDVSKAEINADCQNKLFIMSKNMETITPYYHLMFQSIPRKAVTAIPTMAVTEDELFYNQGFVNSLSVPELTFVTIHEMLHIAMMHSARHGKRHNELWNIACDLYINELIIRDFGCKFGGTEVQIKDSFGKQGTIKVPPYGVFLATIGETLDFGVDTPESIYEKLLKENPNFGNKNQSGSGNMQTGQSSQQSGNSSQSSSSNGSDSGQSQGQSSGQQGGDEQGSSGSQGEPQDGQGSGQQDGDGQGQGNQDQNKDKNNSGSDSERSPFADENGLNSSQSTLNVEIIDSDNGEYNEELVEVEVVYNGKVLKGTTTMDITSKNEKRTSPEDTKSSLDDSQMALQRIVTKRKLAEQEGKSCALTSSSEVCERYIRFGLSAKYDWVRVLKNVAKVDPKKMYTLARPNKAYMQRGITLATRHEIGKPERLRGIKFAMDVSGSVTQGEMDAVFTKISEILDLYKIEAELIYWDTTVNSVGNFKDLKGLKAIKPLGGGGTDLTCVFNYLLGKTRCNGKSEETPLRDISLVMIFTDGCFSLSHAKDYEKYFGSKVVFVANDGCAPFDIPFGKLAMRSK